MIRLRKYYDTTRNTVYESQLSEDMNSIEKEINNLDGDLRNHKSDFQAHTSDQITHQGFSLRTYIESLYNRMRNLILNADGTNVKEVIDARVDTDGYIAPLLKERLDREYTKLLKKIKRTVNVDDYGADPTGVNDSTEAFKKALGNGKVRLNLSAGTYIVKGVKLPSWTYIVGQGMGVTTLKLHEDTPASEWVITNADHASGNRNITVEGMTLDWNPERQGGVGATGGLHSSCLTFAQVKFGIVREVEGINPGLHCFDASAPTYDISATNYTQQGCRYIWFDHCIGSGYGDDGITTHYSEYIFISNCIMTHPSGKAHATGKANSNGIEIDDGTKHVWILDCYTEGNVRGIEVKAHGTWPAAQDVHIRGHQSFRDVRAYDLRHIGHHLASEPWSETARDVTLVDCSAREPIYNDLYAGLEPKALVISAYQRVTVLGFTALGDPTYDYKGTPVIAFQYKSRKININGLNISGFAKAGSDVRIYGGDQRTDDVRISNFTIHDSAPEGISIGGGVYYVTLMNGIAHTRGGSIGISSPNNQADITAVRAVGYTNAAVLAGQKYSSVPTNIKGGFRAAARSGSPLTDTSAIIAGSGTIIAKGERNFIAGIAGGASTEGSRNGVMFSYNSHTKGASGSSVVMASKNVINTKEYSIALGHGDGNPSEGNKKIELDAIGGNVRATNRVESVSDLKDFAEYFESTDGHKIEASYLVALEGEKIRKADAGDKILGVVSKTAGLVLGGAAFDWKDRYLRDEFGGIIYREVYDGERVITVPAENPDYDPSEEYKPREERDEWHVIGLIGQVFVRIDSTVRVGDSVSAIKGIATKAESNGYGTVMKIEVPYDEEKGYGIAKMIVTPQH
ncbi:peptidase G2 [Bacillus spizizenii]|uniref:peptidase G2 autoproteolytic cleavage domain-containing protein n=1 Tax=Bacillus inaquosorum TaxID=483913 RepID=UPI0022806F0E|nr:peptidase G2 autoproteolytic cleavage domain-containing protein [Bacillus inaquosorum]MCY8324247.1 peptidase G2 [Bacillus spizizenii]MCY9071914.1 peptidase G2 [Bacillus inaquosorum]MEC0661396.1 peptidase G2 autoproteolytic cleavage domain-containing protein [Bacillus spizizenii]MEC0703068.1 peptidase G2 autoproteolytic cleavage domain-containing protein [Bacillus spizizenii]